MEGGHAFFSILQLVFYISVLVSHYLVLFRSSFQFFDVSFVVFCQCLHFCFLMQLVVVIIVVAYIRRDEICNLHKAVATNFFDYLEPYEGPLQKLQAEMHRERKLLLPIPVLAGFSGIGIIIVAPIFDNFANIDFKKNLTMNSNLPYPFADYPYSTDDALSYYITAAFQLILAFIIASTIGTGGFMYIVLAQNLSLQMKILIDSFASIEKRTEMVLATQFGKKYTLSVQKLYAQEDFSYCYKKCLKTSLQHHQVILRHFYEWKTLFSVPVFASYATGSVVIALSLLRAGSVLQWQDLPASTLSSYILCVGEVAYMLAFSVFSQRITDLNEDLRFQVYCTKWYYCDESVKRSLRIFQEVTKRPMTFVPCGLVPANMATFANVLRTAYTYYNLVNAFDTRK